VIGNFDTKLDFYFAALIPVKRRLDRGGKRTEG
jgi:hypothetical protein